MILQLVDILLIYFSLALTVFYLTSSSLIIYSCWCSLFYAYAMIHHSLPITLFLSISLNLELNMLQNFLITPNIFTAWMTNLCYFDIGFLMIVYSIFIDHEKKDWHLNGFWHSFSSFPWVLAFIKDLLYVHLNHYFFHEVMLFAIYAFSFWFQIE